MLRSKGLDALQAEQVELTLTLTLTPISLDTLQAEQIELAP